jgi:murein DD-endopeptidase MepM/ murein hydrolase activator NlpD
MLTHFPTKKGDPCYDGCDASPSYCSATCGDAANALVVKHDDGTAAAYLHLNSPYTGVKKGTRVELGQPIALSGSTGWSTGPHLHFQAEVKGCSSWYCQSIPIDFEGIGKPDAGDLLTSKNCP